MAKIPAVLSTKDKFYNSIENSASKVYETGDRSTNGMVITMLD